MNLISLQDNVPDVKGTFRAVSGILLSLLSCTFIGFIAKLFSYQGAMVLIIMIALSILSHLLLAGLGFYLSCWDTYQFPVKSKTKLVERFKFKNFQEIEIANLKLKGLS